MSPYWNKTLILKQNRQRWPAKPLLGQPEPEGTSTPPPAEALEAPSWHLPQSLRPEALGADIRRAERGVDEASVTNGPMAELEPGDPPLLVVAVGKDLWQSPPPPLASVFQVGLLERRLSVFCTPRQPVGPPVQERRTKGCSVRKEPGLVTGLIGSESHRSSGAVILCLHSKGVNHRDVQSLAAMCGGGWGRRV